MSKPLLELENFSVCYGPVEAVHQVALTVGEGEKPKVFRDSLIGNIQDFIGTFNSRNLMNDAELAALVEKAKGVLVGAEPEKLRKNQDTRAAIAAKFAEIKANLDGMITTRKGRNFDFSE